MFKYQTEIRIRYYNQVIDVYKKTGYTSYRIAKLGIVPLSENTIEKWISNFVAEKGKITPHKVTIMRKHQETTSSLETNNEVEALQKRIKELEAQLLRAEIQAEAYDEMINVAESRFKIPIRKKLAPNSSKPARKGPWTLLHPGSLRAVWSKQAGILPV